MIWNSIPVMTVIDLLVVVMAIGMYGAAVKARVFKERSRGPLLAVTGISIIGLFYFVDLLLMWLGPPLIGNAAMMRAMEYLHLNVLWIVTVVAIVLIFLGFLLAARDHGRNEERLRLMTDSMPIGIAYVDRDLTYQFVNEIYAGWYRRPKQDIEGKSCSRT